MPRTFNTPHVSFDGLDVTVQTQEDSVRISFYEYLESEQTVRSFVGNYAEFNVGSDTVLVCLEKHNYKPYIFKITPDLYIQNKTITENNEYYTHEAKIGTNVTNTQPTGDVVINMSNIVIHADAVEIHPNTTIKKSNFTIITSQ